MSGDVLEISSVLHVFSGKCHSCVLLTVPFLVQKKSSVCNAGGHRVRDQRHGKRVQAAHRKMD